jgi:hypothetical protein
MGGIIFPINQKSNGKKYGIVLYQPLEHFLEYGGIPHIPL